MRPEINWQPFNVAPNQAKGDLTRSLDTKEGIGDRLRAAAFAEFQAREAFLWAAAYYDDAAEDLKQAWRFLAQAEQRHLDWLLNRMTELKIDLRERLVSEQLWISLVSCPSAKEFAIYMAGAEERGRKAGLRFHQALSPIDPITAEIFRKIAEEEIAHIALAQQFFPLSTAASKTLSATQSLI